MGEQKACKKKGRNKGSARYYSSGSYMHNRVRDLVRHVLTQPNDEAAEKFLIDFATERGGLTVLRSVQAKLAARDGAYL